MLSDARLKAFLPTVDPVRSRAFYETTLGFSLLSQDSFALEFDCRGVPLRITTVRELNPHPFTVLGWDVDDMETTIAWLNRQGVKCEKFGFFPQDTLGIWIAPDGTQVAWFKDPDGNLLSVSKGGEVAGQSGVAGH